MSDDNNSPPNLLQLPDNSIMEANMSCGIRFDDDLVQSASSTSSIHPGFISHYPASIPDPLQHSFVPLIPQIFSVNEYSSNPMSLLPSTTTSNPPVLTLTTAANPLPNPTSIQLPSSTSVTTNQPSAILTSTAPSNSSSTTINNNPIINTTFLPPTSISKPLANPTAPIPSQSIPYKINPLEISHPSQYLELLPSVENTYIFDKKLNKVNILLNGSLSGNFFISRAKPDDEAQESKDYDLTFYRRNLFQISCTIRNARDAYYAVTTNNEYSRILSLKLGISVSGSDETKPIKLLYSPPKNTSNNGPNTPTTNSPAEIEPNLKRVIVNDSGYDEVIDWKRLQFSSATAHNGRKRLQNFFTITVTLYAELENTQRIELIKSHSRPIVVRGRNPRFYQLRENIPLSENPLINRTKPFKSYTATTSNARNSIPASTKDYKNAIDDAIDPDVVTNSALTISTNNSTSSPQSPEIKHNLVLSNQSNNNTTTSSNPHKRFKKSKTTTLSIYDDDKNKTNDEYDATTCNNNNDDQESNSMPPLEASPSSPSSASEPEDQDHSEEQSLMDPDDVLLDHYHTYQYIAIDHAYWSPPVEVVYRPHATKHMFPTQQQLDQQIEAQHQQLIGGKGLAVGSISNSSGISLKRKFSE